MKHGPIQIRNAEVVRDIRELANRTGQPITEAVARAVRIELEKARRFDDQDIERRRQAVDEAVARFQALPIIGPLLTDDDLYDEDGLPK